MESHFEHTETVELDTPEEGISGTGVALAARRGQDGQGQREEWAVALR
ncbi:hypothetical protein [Vitiosangium sp. GDMCC 1.1324]|nr:hypothetical protein [Vitiosangium sp. GDMCC 1.1324]